MKRYSDVQMLSSFAVPAASCQRSTNRLSHLDVFQIARRQEEHFMIVWVDTLNSGVDKSDNGKRNTHGRLLSL
jgi:hypothetical protein